MNGNYVYDPSTWKDYVPSEGDTIQVYNDFAGPPPKIHLPYSNMTVEGVGPKRTIIDVTNGCQELNSPGYPNDLKNRAVILVHHPLGYAYDGPPIVNIKTVNLDIRGARTETTAYTQASGIPEAWYLPAAVGVYATEGFRAENCRFADCNNGFFAKSEDLPNRVCRRFVLSHCIFEGSGNPTDGGNHNAYTEVAGIVFEFCKFGYFMPGSAGGMGSHDRNCGAVYRYCEFWDGSRLLRMVDSQDSAALRALEDAGGPDAVNHVYGCLFVKPNDKWHASPVHFGGDGTSNTPRRLLRCHFNTFINLNSWDFPSGSGDLEGTEIFKAGGLIQCVNNIFCAVSPDPSVGRGFLDLAAVDEYSKAGFLEMWTNGMPSDIRYTQPPPIVQYEAPDYPEYERVLFDDPGLADAPNGDCSLTPDSPCRGKAVGLGPDWQLVAFQPSFGPDGIIWKPRTSWKNLGAWED